MRKAMSLVAVALLALSMVLGGAGCKDKKAEVAKQQAEAAVVNWTTETQSGVEQAFSSGRGLVNLFRDKGAFKLESAVLKNLDKVLSPNKPTYADFVKAKPVLEALDGKVRHYTNLGKNPEYQKMWDDLKGAMKKAEAANDSLQSAIGKRAALLLGPVD
jgi:hypothetical protein